MVLKSETIGGSAKMSRPTQSDRTRPFTKPSTATRREYCFLDDFQAQPWRSRSRRRAYGVYALGLLAGRYESIDLWDEASVDGADDKDVDLCLVDTETGRAFIAQSVVLEKWGKPTAPTNKADDLLSAANWLLNANVATVPESLRSKARELRDAIAQKTVQRITILFIHNCRESSSVETALKTVAEGIRQWAIVGGVAIQHKELGLGEIQRLYASLTKPIVIERNVDLPSKDWTTQKGPNWKAWLTSISGPDLQKLHKEYGDDLFSANLRGFLDMLSRKQSVNRGILDTIQKAPGDFWVFNNGITLITKKCSTHHAGLRLNGISIINGAQTTGAIGHATPGSVKKVRVPCRVVQCTDANLLRQIVKNNNTQNEIRPLDLQSNDPTQIALRKAFATHGIQYVHRRVGSEPIRAEAIQADTVGPMLAAFQGKFQTAARQRRRIFEDDVIYPGVFPRTISCEHVFAIQCLADAVGEYKVELSECIENLAASDNEKAIWEICKHSTSKMFIVSLVGRLLQQVFDSSARDHFQIRARSELVRSDRKKVRVAWRQVVDAITPNIPSLVKGKDAYDVVRSEEELAGLATALAGVIEGLKAQYVSSFALIRSACTH